MFEGEVCKFYELADDVNNNQEECLKNYADDPSFYIDASGFRYTAFVMSLIMPACILVIEIVQNQILLEWKHLVYQYLFTIFYMLVTALWQVGTGDAVIFPETLDWICASRTDPDDASKLINDPDCLWS